MATVVNTFPDRRAEILGSGIGRGLGSIVSSVIEAKKKRKNEGLQWSELLSRPRR